MQNAKLQLKIQNSKKIKKELPSVQKNISLKNYTTFKIGGKAKYFFAAKSKESLISAIKAAKRINLPFFMLGRGSNLLVSDKEYKGLIIKIQNTKYPAVEQVHYGASKIQKYMLKRVYLYHSY